MIWTTRFDGSEVIINADLIETIAPTPDTVITLIDGSRYVVSEPPEEVVRRIQTYRAAVLRLRDDPIVDDPQPAARLSAVTEDT